MSNTVNNKYLSKKLKRCCFSPSLSLLFHSDSSSLVFSMNVETGEGSMSVAAAVPLQFPEGIRVLAVDDDQTCLQIMGRMLERCMYKGMLFIVLFFMGFLIFAFPSWGFE